jgi:hypothetical protein
MSCWSKSPTKDTESVMSGLIKSAQRQPRALYNFLTWDRGKELADHPRLPMATDVDVHFCDPQSGGNADQTKIPNPSGKVCGVCCVDQLRSPPIPVKSRYPNVGNGFQRIFGEHQF